jgi:hypothetical protein
MEVKEYTQNGWNEYKRLVLAQLEGLTKKTEIIEEKLDDAKRDIEDKIDKKVGVVADKLDVLKTDFTVLKTKAVVYGALAGFFIALLVQVVLTILQQHGK